MFRIVDYGKAYTQYRESIIFIKDNWNDFGYSTLFHCYYVDSDGNSNSLNTIRIAKKGMKHGESTCNFLPDAFDQLGTNFYSMWESARTYKTVYDLCQHTHINFFKLLNDVAYNLDIYNDVKNEQAFIKSFLRYFSSRTITKQFNRIANTGILLSPYVFKYLLDKSQNVIEFDVEPNSNPPTNIHAIIGRNGVGKTHLLKNMIDNICYLQDYNEDKFIYDNEESDLFENVLCISFSPFDNLNITKNTFRKDIKFFYLGIHNYQDNNSSVTIKTDTPKTLDDFIKECFLSNLELVLIHNEKKEDFRSLLNIIKSEYTEDAINDIDLLLNNSPANQSINHDYFDNLSSGHKVVMSILAFCANNLAEKSILFIDEIENHLHPPLLALLIRALSVLLINRNSVAIMATHSPVVLQNIPSRCVTILERYGNCTSCRRPRYETFGGNIGTLTCDVFGYTSESCSFHAYLKNLASKCSTYDEAITKINKEVSDEGRAVLFNYFMSKE